MSGYAPQLLTERILVMSRRRNNPTDDHPHRAGTKWGSSELRLAVFLLTLLLSIWGCAESSSELPIQVIPVAGTRAIELLSVNRDSLERKWTALIYYISNSEAQSRLGPFAFGSVTGPANRLRFDLVVSRDADLLGIAEHTHPTVILVLYQFSSGFNWPGGGGEATNSRTYLETARSLVDELTKDNPRWNFQLGKAIPYFHITDETNGVSVKQY